MKKTGKEFEKFVEIVRTLRKKCPWDKVQTFETLKPYLLEEVYEAIEAIDNKNFKELADETGDMLLHVVMLAVFAEEKIQFDIDKVINLISSKMMRRHPHVFGGRKLKTKEQVLAQWKKIKSAEKKKQGLTIYLCII